jgi:hypothetical protein
LLRTSKTFGLKPVIKWKGKNISQNHPLLKFLQLKNISVSCSFKDDEVLSNDFLDLIEKRIEVAVPFVQLINEVSSRWLQLETRARY